MSAPGKFPVSHRFFCKFYSLLDWLDEKRLACPFVAQLITTAIGSLLAWAVVEWLTKNLSANSIGLSVRLAVSIVVGLIINRLLLSGFFPTVRYAKQSIAMRTMGLLLVSTGQTKYSQIVSKYLKFHDNSRKVRVICICGEYLFRLDGQNGPAPLYQSAISGNLDVILPACDSENPTLIGRFETYDDAYRARHALGGVHDLVRKVDDSKKFLEVYPKNVITQHCMLCMWRVVIFSKHCIVQSYFPNPDSQESFLAPVFVFENMAETKYSYYATYEEMFSLIKTHGLRNSLPRPQVIKMVPVSADSPSIS